MADNPQTETPPEKPSAASRLHAAFLGVFGPAGRRNADQRMVLEHIRKVGYADAPIFAGDKAGTFDALAAAHRDGARTIHLIIERQLELARQAAMGKIKPKSKR